MTMQEKAIQALEEERRQLEIRRRALEEERPELEALQANVELMRSLSYELLTAWAKNHSEGRERNPYLDRWETFTHKAGEARCKILLLNQELEEIAAKVEISHAKQVLLEAGVPSWAIVPCDTCGRLFDVRTGRIDAEGCHGQEGRIFQIGTVECPTCAGESEGDVYYEYAPETTYRCAICNGRHLGGEMTSLIMPDGEEESICRSCMDRNDVSFCETCGQGFLSREEGANIYTTSGDHLFLCDGCMEDYYRCEGCGYYEHENGEGGFIDGDFYCSGCYEGRLAKDRGPIRDYHDGHPQGLNFFNTGEDEEEGNKLYMGVELEICDGGTDGDNAYDILDQLGQALWHAEVDGSVKTGFELISQPMTYRFWKSHMEDVHAALLKAQELGYLGSREEGACDSCGLHVHVSRAGLSADCIARIILVIDKHWDWLVTFSRRRLSDLTYYANKYDLGDKAAPPKVKIDEAKRLSVSPSNRYRALNLSNRHTVEFRWMGSTVDPRNFEASVDFIHWLVKYAEAHSADEILERPDNSLPCRGYTEALDQYLDRYMGERETE